MTSIAVKDLKKPRELRDTLARERQVMVTKDGRPFAIMVGVEPDAADDTIREVRRAMFSTAVLRARRQAEEASLSPEDIEAEIKAVREARRQ
jgi:antitoxin (DNA-binding transcriptional repressor) of toxin-antitoxin stability system